MRGGNTDGAQASRFLRRHDLLLLTGLLHPARKGMAAQACPSETAGRVATHLHNRLTASLMDKDFCSDMTHVQCQAVLLSCWAWSCYRCHTPNI